MIKNNNLLLNITKMIKYIFCDRCYYINWNRNISVRKCNCCLKIIEPTLKIGNNFTISQNNLYKIKTDFSVHHSNFGHLAHLIRVGYRFKEILLSDKYHYIKTIEANKERKDEYFFVPDPKELYRKSLKFYRKILIFTEIREGQINFLKKYTSLPNVIIDKIIEFSCEKPIDINFLNYIKLFMKKSKSELNYDVKYFLNSP